MTLNRLIVVGICLLAVSALRAADSPAKPDTSVIDLTPKTETASGVYSQIRLTVEPGWPAPANSKQKSPLPYTLLINLRDDVPVSVWAVGMNGPEVVHFRGTDAKLTDAGLRGKITLFFGNGTTGYAASELPLTLDLQRSAATLAGTVAAGTEKPAKAAGQIIGQEQLAQCNALPAGKDWPNWFGVDRTVRGPDSSTKLVDSLSLARPVWRSESFIPTAFGQAADFRYALRAAAQGTCGGASSPVVAGGRVFQYHYVPAGATDEKAVEAAFSKADHPLADFQKAWVQDMYRESADDVVTAMDAATGRTLWRTTLPRRSLNLQTHKHRGVNPTPLAAADSLYVVNYLGRVYCLDPKSGQVRWEYPKPADKPFVGVRGQAGSGSVPVGGASPVLVDRILAVTLKEKLVAIDAASGKEKWQSAVFGEAELMSWSTGGKTYLVAVGVKRADKSKNEPEQTIVSLVNPADRKVLWQQPAEFVRQYRLPVFTGDLLIGYRYGAEAANNITAGEKNALVAVRLKESGIEPAWKLEGLPGVVDSYGVCAAGDFVYLSGEKEVWAIDAKSGKIAAKVPGPGGARTQVIYSAGDRLFLLPEGRHGNSGVIMLSAVGPQTNVFPVGGATYEPAAAPAAKPAKPAGKEDDDAGGSHSWRGYWKTPNPNTTAYANHQIIYPVVDGRIFIRGGDGIYCYDLRAK